MTKSPTAQFLADAIENSGLTQREIAGRTGFEKPSIISMMKTGETKVPIDRIPALAVASKADPREFLRVAMREYHPEMWEITSGSYTRSSRDRRSNSQVRQLAA